MTLKSERYKRPGEFAKLCNVRGSAISNLIKRGTLVALLGDNGRDKYLDVLHPKNAEYIDTRMRKIGGLPARSSTPAQQQDTAPRRGSRGRQMVDQERRAVELAMEKKQLEVDKLRNQVNESDLKIRERRGDLIDRNLVERFVNGVYAIESTQFKSLGPKLSATLAAVAKTDDPAIKIAFEKVIDDEVYKALQNITYKIEVFLGKIKSESANAMVERSTE